MIDCNVPNIKITSNTNINIDEIELNSVLHITEIVYLFRIENRRKYHKCYYNK